MPRAPLPSHDGWEKVTRKIAETSLHMRVLGVFSLENGLRYYCTAFFQFEGIQNGISSAR